MICGNKKYDSIVITSSNTRGDIVTSNEHKEVIAVISDEEIIVKNGYEIKMIPAPNATA